jgi:hypothetical protein
MRNLIPIVMLAVFLAATCPPAFAEENATKKKAATLPWDKFTLNLGTFVSSTDSSVRLSAKGVGITVDVEEALGLDTTTTVFRTAGIWRFSDNRRHRLDLSWFALRRDGDKQLTQDLTIDGVTYPTGTQVNTAFDLDVYKAAYSYSFLQDDRIDVGVAIGLYVMPIRFDLYASGLLTGQVSETFTAPLPVIGLRADFLLTPKWILKTNIDVLYVAYEQYAGYIFDSRLAVEYKAFKHVGFGLGVENFNLGIEAEGEDYPGIDLVGQIDYEYIGAMLYASIYF